MPNMFNTTFLNKRDTIKAHVNVLSDSVALNVMLDDPQLPVAAHKLSVFADSLDQLLDLGYAIVDAVNAVDAEPIDFGDSLEANVPITAVNAHAERIAEQSPAPVQHPIGERFEREAEQTI